MKRAKRDATPTVDDYIKASVTLATQVRRLLENPKSVTRGEMKRALEAFEDAEAAAT